jgi:hypothetical protein
MVVVQTVWRKSYEQIVDSSLLSAWRADDPGATRQKYAGKQSVFGYKVHAVICHHADLAVALAAERYQRPEFYRRRSMVLAHL